MNNQNTIQDVIKESDVSERKQMEFDSKDIIQDYTKELTLTNCKRCKEHINTLIMTFKMIDKLRGQRDKTTEMIDKIQDQRDKSIKMLETLTLTNIQTKK